jgi:hypothetical protein
MLYIFLRIYNNLESYSPIAAFPYPHTPLDSFVESFTTNAKSNLSITALIIEIWCRFILSSSFALFVELMGLADAIIIVGDLILAFIPFIYFKFTLIHYIQ